MRVGMSGSSVALVDWSHLLEDFLDSLGISIPDFLNEMDGGWMFGYIEALRRAGVRAVLFCFSARVGRPERHLHTPTGATVWLLPSPWAYQAARRQVPNPYASTLMEAAGDIRGARRLVLEGLQRVMPYVATPMRELAGAIRWERCGAILCQDYEHPRFDACSLLGWRMGLPVFATFQGGESPQSRVELPLRRVTMRRCAGLVIASARESERVQRCYRVPAEKIARIFNPLDLDQCRPMDREVARRGFGIPGAARVVVWHGRVMLKRKGLDVLLKAWARVCSARPGQDLRLLLLGTGDDAPEVHQSIEALQLAGVMWRDEYVRDREIIRRYLSAADMYVLPSRHEGFPVALMEAMAFGLPVVATDTHGVADILHGGEGAGGMLVPRGKPATLAAALGQLLDAPDHARALGRNARQYAESHFSLGQIGEQLRAFLSLEHPHLSVPFSGDPLARHEGIAHHAPA